MATGTLDPLRPRLAAGLLLLALASCALPGLEEGEVSLTPVANLYVPSGRARLSTGARANGANSFKSALGLDDRETDPGATLSFGDGFSGLDLTYDQYRRKRSSGRLANDFGALNRGETTRSDLDYLGYRIGYVASVYGYDFPSGIPLGTDYELTPHVQLGLGGGLHRVRQDLTVFDVDRSLTEDFSATGIVPFATLRAQVNLDTIKVRVDQSLSLGDWGDMTGLYRDSLYTVRWEAAYAVDVLVGWRQLSLEAQGRNGGNKFELDTTYTGWVLGLHIIF